MQGADVFFLLMGAILVFAMHAGFAFLETGTVRHKNQVNALVKILVDFAISTVVYFLIGYTIAYGVGFFQNASAIAGGAEGYGPQGYTLVRFFFLCTFAAAVPAIISGGIAERAKFWPQAAATAALVGLFYPLLEGVYWNGNFGLQESFFNAQLGAPFKDFAGSIVVHAFGGWCSLGAVLLLGPRLGRYEGRGTASAPSSIPWLAMGSWLLCIGWFGFNVMSAQRLEAVSGLVAVCAGSDVMHPLGSLVVGGVAGAIFVQMFQVSTNKWKIDDVLGVWALHGLCGLWGGIACGIFGLPLLGGAGGVTFASQLVGSIAGAAFGFFVGIGVYGVLKLTVGIRLTADEEHRGADLSIHNIRANPEEDVRTFGS